MRTRTHWDRTQNAQTQVDAISGRRAWRRAHSRSLHLRFESICSRTFLVLLLDDEDFFELSSFMELSGMRTTSIERDLRSSCAEGRTGGWLGVVGVLALERRKVKGLMVGLALMARSVWRNACNGARGRLGELNWR